MFDPFAQRLGEYLGRKVAHLAKWILDLDHHYLSTACYHGLHQRCIRNCKFCGLPCTCDCGHDGGADVALVEYLVNALEHLPYERIARIDIALAVVAAMRSMPRSER